MKLGVGAHTLLGQPLETTDYGIAFEHLHLVDNSRIPAYIVTILQWRLQQGVLLWNHNVFFRVAECVHVVGAVRYLHHDTLRVVRAACDV